VQCYPITHIHSVVDTLHWLLDAFQSNSDVISDMDMRFSSVRQHPGLLLIPPKLFFNVHDGLFPWG